MHKIIVVLGLLTFGAHSANAQFYPPPQPVLPTIVSASVDNPEGIFEHQEKPAWCWAACNQMLLESIDVGVTQTDQATKRMEHFGGNLEDGAGASFSQASYALKGQYTNSEGTTLTVKAKYLYEAETTDLNIFETLINSLKDGHPVIMATRQHGRVCVGVDYIQTPSGYDIIDYKFLDPEASYFQVYTYTKTQFVGIGLIEHGVLGIMTISFKKMKNELVD